MGPIERKAARHTTEASLSARVGAEGPMAFLDDKGATCTVSLPWLGLQPAVSYEQMIDSLLALDSAVDGVMDRVERRVADMQSELSGLERRIDAAAERGRRVVGSTTATVVFSAARYPEKDLVMAWQSTMKSFHPCRST